MEINEKLERLLSRIDEVGGRPAYMKGGSLNDKLEYERLLAVFRDECLNAFRDGLRFSKTRVIRCKECKLRFTAKCPILTAGKDDGFCSCGVAIK